MADRDQQEGKETSKRQRRLSDSQVGSEKKLPQRPPSAMTPGPPLPSERFAEGEREKAREKIVCERKRSRERSLTHPFDFGHGGTEGRCKHNPTAASFEDRPPGRSWGSLPANRTREEEEEKKSGRVVCCSYADWVGGGVGNVRTSLRECSCRRVAALARSELPIQGEMSV